MTKEDYIRNYYNNDADRIMYDYYLEVNQKDEVLEYHEFCVVIDALCFSQMRNKGDLFRLISTELEQRFKILKVLNKQNQIIGLV